MHHEFHVWDFGGLDTDPSPSPELINPDAVTDLVVTSAVPVPELREPLTFAVSSAYRLRDYQFTVPRGFPLFSTALRQALAQENLDQIQYLPTRLVVDGTTVRTDYRVGNVLASLACFDWHNSVYDESYRQDGVVIHIDSLRLTAAAAASGRRMFRLAEAPTVLLISDDLRRALQARELSGLGFQRAEGYGTAA